MTTKRKSTPKPVREVEVLSRAGARKVQVRVSRPEPEEPEAEPALEPGASDEPLVEDDDDDDEVVDFEPRPFEPAPEDDRDFRWFFSLGLKERPQGLTPDRAKRWKRIHRCLDGGGRALCLHYTNPLGTELALAPAVHEPGLYFSGMAGLATPGACADFVRRVLERRATAPMVDRRLMYVRQAQEAEDAAFDSARDSVLRELEHEYGLYLERKAKPRLEPTDYAVFSLESLKAYLGSRYGATSVHILRQFFSEHALELATWGGVRVTALFARGDLHAFSRDVARASLDMGDMDLEERLEATAATRGEASRRDSFDAVRDMAGNYDAAMALGEEGAFLDLFRIERGAFDRSHRRYENDPRVQLDLGRDPTVTEIAVALGRSPKVIRELLVQFRCPGAHAKQARLPLSWFSSAAGLEFRDRVLRAPSKAPGRQRKGLKPNKN